MNIRHNTSLNIIPHVLKKQSKQTRSPITEKNARANIQVSEKISFHS